MHQLSLWLFLERPSEQYTAPIGTASARSLRPKRRARRNEGLRVADRGHLTEEGKAAPTLSPKKMTSWL